MKDFILRKENIPYIIFAVYLSIHAFVPIKRSLIGWNAEAEIQFFSYLCLLPNLPVICLLLLFPIELKHNSFLLQRVFDYKVWMRLCYIILVTMFAVGIFQDITYTPIHPVFLTWRGTLLVIVTFMTCFSYLKNELGVSRAWLISASSSLLIVGLWESLYQTCNYYFIYKEFFAIEALHNELKMALRYVILAIPTLIYYGLKFNWRPKNPILIIAILLVFSAAWLILLNMGYWIEIYCDHNLEIPIWVHSDPVCYTRMILGKSAKTLLALLVFLLVRGFVDNFSRNQKEESV